MNLSGLSNFQIEKAIEKMQKGIEIKPNSPEATELQISIDRALEELQRRAQKKSAEPSANQGQLQKTPIRDAAAKVPQEIKNEVEKWADQVEREAAQQNRDQSESVQAFEVNRVVVAKIENPKPITVPVVEMDFKDRYGNIYTRALDQTDIIALLKTYFKRVAVRMARDGQYTDAYNSSMGQTVWKLFNGWHIIHKKRGEGIDYPIKEECFPGLKNASQAQKVCAELLHRWASNEK